VELMNIDPATIRPTIDLNRKLAIHFLPAQRG
jgi:hypothetical protein